MSFLATAFEIAVYFGLAKIFNWDISFTIAVAALVTANMAIMEKN